MLESLNELHLNVQQLLKNTGLLRNESGVKFEHFKLWEIKFAMSFVMFSFDAKKEKFCVYYLWSNVSPSLIRWAPFDSWKETNTHIIAHSIDPKCSQSGKRCWISHKYKTHRTSGVKNYYKHIKYSNVTINPPYTAGSKSYFWIFKINQ